MINEISTNRILKHFQDDSCLTIISSYRTERTEQENRKLLNNLKQKVRSLKLGFSELISRLSEVDYETREVITSDKRSLMIYGISLEDAIKFGQELQQSSIIYKNADKCAEVCTTEFIDYDDTEHKVGNIVRTFNVLGSTPLNLQDAKDIFEKRKGGPASLPIKSNRAFKLENVLEVESPKGSTFSEKERYMKIF